MSPPTTETTMARRPTRDPYARPAINTLERLHAELGGQILENKQRHGELAEQMRHVEAVIKMLDPGYSLRAISVKRRQPKPMMTAPDNLERTIEALKNLLSVAWSDLANPLLTTFERREARNQTKLPGAEL